MKYYIGSENSSGISCDTFEDFVEYLREMIEKAEEEGKEWLELTVA